VAGAPLTVVGDWDDVRAAVIVGTDGCETVILDSTRGPTEQVFRIQTIMDGHGTVTARRDPGGGSEAIPITFTCTILPFGDPEREQCILDGTAQRLRDLKGVDYRPLR
jgi:hypothetical protein